MKQFHANRLWKLARHLWNVKQSTFCLYGWKEENSIACKTTACACGHACSIRSFRRAGLFLVPSQFCGSSRSFSLRLDLKNGGGFLSDFSAVEKFFDITMDEAENLFSPASYEAYQVRNPRIVAKRIRNLVRKYVKLDKNLVLPRRKTVSKSIGDGSKEKLYDV